MSARTHNPLDLTAEEQDHVRAALHFLHRRTGDWLVLAKALHFKRSTLTGAAYGAAVTPVVAFRVARFAKVSVDDVLTGRFPAPGTCPYCGHVGENNPHG